MCIRPRTCFITSTGQGEPAITPVRSVEKSVRSKSGWLSCAMNIVGTPYRDVQRSASMAASVAPASNPSAGTTMHAPCVVHARLPITMPKQW